MKHARPDYDRIQDPAGLIPADEPVFLIRASDVCAAWAVGAWVDAAERCGVAPHMLQAARDQITRIHDWQAAHGFKKPDMPEARDAE